MVTTVLGKVAVTPKGEWSSTVTYEKLDVVSYNGSSYLSVRTVPAATPLSNTNYWLLLAQKGDTGNGVASIEKTGTSGLTDTYTITFTDGSTSTFTVINGEAATVVLGTVSTGAEGTAVVITNSGDEHNAVLNFTIPRGNTGNGIQGIELTASSGGVKTYTITFTDGNTFSFDVTDGEVTEERLAEALADYALINGYYEDLVAGGSEQLLSSVYEEDNEPYLFRTSGGSMDIGDREEDTIVGGTIVWNQWLSSAQLPDDSVLYNTNSYTANGVTVAKNADGGYTVSTTAEGASANITVKIANTVSVPSFATNHIHCVLLTGGVSGVLLNWSNADYIPPMIYKRLSYSGFNLWLKVTAGTIITTPIKVYPQIFDLTQMFGTTIADYVYSLEQSTAGAGVAWFKKLFSKPYYEYNAGELLSVEGLQSHDMVGFNAWDTSKDTDGKNFNAQGELQNATKYSVSEYIKVVPKAVYYLKGIPGNSYAFAGVWYDSEKSVISVISVSGASYEVSALRTAPDNAAYVRLSRHTSTTEACFNLSWDGERDGEYEPYVKRSYPLDDSLTLRGIPKLDTNNKLYYDGDIYEADGTVTRKYGIVDLGTLNWTYFDGEGHYRFAYNLQANMYGKPTTAVPNAICTKYEVQTYSNIFNNQKIGIGLHSDGTQIVVYDSSYTSAESFKAAMSGVYLVYELATPTNEEAEPYQTPQIVDDFGTEEYVTDSIVPVGHVTKYMPNLKAKLEMAPDSPSDNGDYIVRHTNGLNEYVPLVIPTELPTMPTGSDGTYHLKLTVANGTATLAWEAD